MNTFEELRISKLEKYKKILENLFGGPGSGRNSEGGNEDYSSKTNDELLKEKDRLNRKILKGGKGQTEAAQKKNAIDKELSKRGL